MFFVEKFVMNGRGNPEFGTKYVKQPLGDKPLSKKQLQVRLEQDIHEELMQMSAQERSNFVRAAIAKALEEKRKREATA